MIRQNGRQWPASDVISFGIAVYSSCKYPIFFNIFTPTIDEYKWNEGTG